MWLRQWPCKPLIHPAESTRSSSSYSSGRTGYHRRIARPPWPGREDGSCSFWPRIHRGKPTGRHPTLAAIPSTCDDVLLRRPGLAHWLATLFFEAPIQLDDGPLDRHDRAVFARSLTHLFQGGIGLLFQEIFETFEAVAAVDGFAMSSRKRSRFAGSAIALPPSLEGGNIHAVKRRYLRLCHAARLVSGDRPLSNFLCCNSHIPYIAIPAAQTLVALMRATSAINEWEIRKDGLGARPPFPAAYHGRMHCQRRLAS